jgi:hypothetical protein
MAELTGEVPANREGRFSPATTLYYGEFFAVAKYVIEPLQMGFFSPWAGKYDMVGSVGIRFKP